MRERFSGHACRAPRRDAGMPGAAEAARLLVEERLIEAARVLRALPDARPQRRLTAWPDIVERTVGLDPRAVRATPETIDRTEEAVAWLLWLAPDQQLIVWGRALGATWRALEDRDGRCHVTLRKRWRQGLETIARRLQAGSAVSFQRAAV